MYKVYLYFLIFMFMKNTFPQVPILYYDFESNTNRSTFENVVEQSINSGSGPIERIGAEAISPGYGNDGRGKALWGSNWQMVTSDPRVDATEYYQFSVNTKGFKGISIKFRETCPFSTGPGNIGYNFSSNGTTFKNAGINMTSAGNSNWSDVGIVLYNYPEVNNNSNVIIRIYAYKGINPYATSSGTLAIDNLIITADTIISGVGEISLLNETSFYNSYYSGGTGSAFYNWKQNLVINGPGTVVTLVSPVNFAKKFIINDGSALKCNIYPVWGTCSFTLNKGGAIYTSDPDGIVSGTDSAGTVCVKGTRIYSSEADYYYNGTTAQVTGNGLPSSVNILSIDNVGGVSLSNSVQILDTMKLFNGKLILGNNDLILNDTAVIAGGSSDSYIVTDNSGGMICNKMTQNKDIKFPVGTTASYNPAIINYSGISDTFKVKVKGTFDFALTNPDKVVNSQWSITENTAGGSVASVKFGWIQGQELPGFDIKSDVMIGRWDGTCWNPTHAVISGSGSSEDPFIALTSGLSAFSYFVVGNDGALPVELTNFSYIVTGRELRLNWKTATEKNSNTFDVERKELNNNKWEHRGSIKANFMSNSPKDYSYFESNLDAGKYFYRLRMNDNDGSFQYSNTVAVEINKPGRFALLQNYPNPFNPSTLINYELPADAHVLIEVYDVKGGKVSCLVNEFRKAGFYSVEFNAPGSGNHLSSGIYFYRMSAITANGSKLSIVKKMLYIK